MTAAGVVLVISCPGAVTNGGDSYITSLSIAGKQVNLKKPNANLNVAAAATVKLSPEESFNASIKITLAASTTDAMFCIVTPGEDLPFWQSSKTMSFNNGDILAIRISTNSGQLLYYKIEIKVQFPSVKMGGLWGKVLILQAYGTGDKYDGGVSHSFIELYNKSEKEADLSGYSLQYSEGGSSWKVLNLNGKKIPAGHSFLVLGKKMNEQNNTTGTGLLQLQQSGADIIWNDGSSPLEMSNKSFKIFLVESTSAITVKNPFDSTGDRKWEKTEGYVDFLGVNDNEETSDIDGFETSRLNDANASGPYLLSKGKSVRRINLNDTDDNGRDFDQVEWRSESDKVISEEDFEACRPRSTKDGKWNPEYTKSLTGSSNAQIGSLKVASINAGTGTPAAAYSAVTSPGSVSISNLVAGSAPVDITIAPGATFKTAKASGSGVPQWSTSASPVYTFANGDFLYIEVTSKNGTAINVFKIAVTVTTVSSPVTVSGSYTLNINSTIPQQRVAIEAHTSADAANGDLAARTEANISNSTWTMAIPSGQAVWFKIIVTDTSDYSFGRVVSTSGQSYSANASNISLTLGPFAPPELKSFALINADVVNNAKQNKTASINQSTGVISFGDTNFTTVSANTIIDFHKLAANFTLSEGSKLYVENAEQKSGVTANNYYQEVVFTVVSEDNVPKTYTVPAPVSGSYRVVGTRNFQTQGFGVLDINTTDKNTGMPSGRATKLNLVWNTTGTYTYTGPEGRVLAGGTDIKARGNWSYRYENPKSFTLRPNEAVGFDRYDYHTGEYVTLPESRRWALRINSGDTGRIKDSLCREMAREVLTNLGWQPHCDWVFVFINGEYKGLYNLVETIRIEEGRLDIGPPASLSTPDGGFIVQMNNWYWYADDVEGGYWGNSNYVFDSLYNFVSGTGLAWTFEMPDSNLGWYYPDPPEGNGNLSYSDTTYFPLKGIALGAKKNRPPGEWTVPNDFGQQNGMGSKGMRISDPKVTGVNGSRTLNSVYPNWESSTFVKISQFIQDAEDTIFAQNWGSGGTGGYHNYIDIDSFIDFQILCEMVSDWELQEPNGRYMHYDPITGKLKMGPLWDLDKAFQNDKNTRPGFMKSINFWYGELLKDPYYVGRLKTRWNAVKGQFSPTGGDLSPYIDAQNTRFARITGYSNPISISGNRLGWKTTITNNRNSLDTIINGY